jgi:hypothetical protein
MILGLSLPAFTALHVIISLVGIGTGIAVLLGMVFGDRLTTLTAIFLATTVLTSVTGFLFPFVAFGPPHAFGVISLVVLAAAIIGRYGYRMAGRWRLVYIVGALVALYLNIVVAVVQTFEKLSFAHPFAPTQSEPPFLITQGVTLGIFVLLGVVAAWRFRPAPKAARLPASAQPA